MTAPKPSTVRVVRIYGDAPMRWLPKHPLDDTQPWWIDATGWLTDPNGQPWDTIGQISVPLPSTITDTALSITGTVISADGLHAGIYFAGGTPGVRQAMNFTIVGATTGAVKGVTITLPIENAAVSANPADEATLHGAVVTIGGFAYPVGVS